jgi:hypothetical protein
MPWPSPAGSCCTPYHFEPAKARFVTYLYGRVHGKVRHFLESERRHRRVESMDDQMLADLAGGESDDPAEALTAREILEGLDERGRALLWGHLAEGTSVRQVAREMGCPHVHLCASEIPVMAALRTVSIPWKVELAKTWYLRGAIGASCLAPLPTCGGSSHPSVRHGHAPRAGTDRCAAVYRFLGASVQHQVHQTHRHRPCRGFQRRISERSVGRGGGSLLRAQR